MFAETQARRLSKYWLSGPAADTVTPLAVHLPGMPDNISTGSDGRIWCAMVAGQRRGGLAGAARTAAAGRRCGACPSGCSRRSSRWWAVAFDPDDGAAVAGLQMTRSDFGVVTGLVEHRGELWMSSIGFPRLRIAPLPS